MSRGFIPYAFMLSRQRQRVLSQQKVAWEGRVLPEPLQPFRTVGYPEIQPFQQLCLEIVAFSVIERSDLQACIKPPNIPPDTKNMVVTATLTPIFRTRVTMSSRIMTPAAISSWTVI